MPFLVCIVPVCPMRSNAAHRSEQTSQLLFGDVVEIVEASGDFVRVKYLYDDYEGWAQRSQLAEINADQFTEAGEKLTPDLVNEIVVNNAPMRIPLGCSLGHLVNGKASWETFTIEYKGALYEPSNNGEQENVMKKVAMQYLNTSYLWGGRSVFGVDCSGFCQMVFRFAGVPLLRDAYQQASQGQAIGFLQEVQFGDLAFFDNDEGRITHVGLLLDQQRIIHASGKVRIDTIDHQGIINVDTGLRTHKLRVIKRIL